VRAITRGHAAAAPKLLGSILPPLLGSLGLKHFKFLSMPDLDILDFLRVSSFDIDTALFFADEIALLVALTFLRIVAALRSRWHQLYNEPAA
jgi:hypothetical protein